MYMKIQRKAWQVGKGLSHLGKAFMRSQRGDILGTIGWMAVMSVILVLVHGLIKGWLPEFVGNVFARMETLI